MMYENENIKNLIIFIVSIFIIISLYIVLKNYDYLTFLMVLAGMIWCIFMLNTCINVFSTQKSSFSIENIKTEREIEREKEKNKYVEEINLNESFK